MNDDPIVAEVRKYANNLRNRRMATCTSFSRTSGWCRGNTATDWSAHRRPVLEFVRRSERTLRTVSRACLVNCPKRRM